jgi:protein-S-isoprenylcysteine O-methyltransferase Ste14
MELISALKIGWLNGWILLCLIYLIFGLLLILFPKDVVSRLYNYNRSSWNKTQRAFYIIGKLLALVCLVLIIFTPLKIGANLFILGITLFTLGLAGFIVALFNFKNTSSNQPVTRGLYRISRHPQVLMIFIMSIGICITIGSWLVLFIVIISSLFLHSRDLAEEKACLERYGDSYRPN